MPLVNPERDVERDLLLCELVAHPLKHLPLMLSPHPLGIGIRTIGGREGYGAFRLMVLLVNYTRGLFMR